MKKRLLDPFVVENGNEKKKINNTEDDKKKKSKFEELPKVLIIHLSSFFDFDSLVQFSSTNQKHKNLFSEFRKGLIYFKRINLVSRFEKKGSKTSKSNFFKQVLLNKDFGMIVEEMRKFNALHFVCSSEEISLEILKYFFENKSDLNFIKVQLKHHSIVLVTIPRSH